MPGIGLLAKAGSSAIGGAKGGLQSALGVVQNIQANKLKQKADSAAPPLVDPTQAAFLSELNQKRASLDAGTAFAAGINNIDATNAGTNEGLIRSGGGDVGGVMQALLQSQRATNDSKNQLFGQGQQQQNFNQSMYGDLLNKVAARKWQLQNKMAEQARAEWAQKKQSGNQNLMAGIAGMTHTGGEGGGSTPSMPSPMQSAGVTTPVGAGDTGTEAGEGSMQSGTPELPGMGGGEGMAGGAEALA